MYALVYAFTAGSRKISWVSGLKYALAANPNIAKCNPVEDAGDVYMLQWTRSPQVSANVFG
jgi:hypothetical protein